VTLTAAPRQGHDGALPGFAAPLSVSAGGRVKIIFRFAFSYLADLRDLIATRPRQPDSANDPSQKYIEIIRINRLQQNLLVF